MTLTWSFTLGSEIDPLFLKGNTRLQASLRDGRRKRGGPRFAQPSRPSFAILLTLTHLGSSPVQGGGVVPGPGSPQFQMIRNYLAGQNLCLV